jgi:hypothetical protein
LAQRSLLAAMEGRTADYANSADGSNHYPRYQRNPRFSWHQKKLVEKTSFNARVLQMNLNPYESPRPEEPYVEHGIGNADAVVRLLIEIRDAQRDALAMQREALDTANKARRFAFVRAIPFLIIIISSFFVTRLLRFTPTPARPPARAVPATPATFPNASSLIRP